MELWNSIQEHLSQKFDKSFSRSILSRVYFKEYQNDNLIILSAEDSFTKGWFEENCVHIMEEYIRDMGMHYEFRVEILPESMKNTKKLANTKIATKLDTVTTLAKAAPSIDTYINPVEEFLSDSFTFENFIPGQCNDFSYKAAEMVSQATKYNPFVIIGGSGTGKTHLAQAIVHSFIKKSPRAKAIFVTSEDFTNDFVESIQKKNMNDFRQKYRTCDLLVIDDIQGLQTRQTTTDELENTFNALISRGSQMVFTSDRPIKKLKDLKTRLRTRLSEGLEVDLKNPEFETRKAILLDMVQKENHRVDHAIIDLIADTIDHNIRELKGTFVKLFAYAELKRKEISLKLAKELLSDKLQIEIPSNLSVSEIQKAVAAYYGIKSSDIKSKSKLHSKSHPRQIAMYIASKYTNNTSTELGNQFHKSHSTVLRSAHKIEQQISTNTNLKKEIEKILLDLSDVHHIH